MNMLKVTDLTIVENYEETGSTAIFATINDKFKFLEWMNEDGLTEKIDSHIRTNQMNAVEELIIEMGAQYREIYLAIDAALEELAHQA